METLKPQNIEASKESNSDFRLYLQAELVRRCQRNPKYSLRAFSKTLKVSPSALSAMLRGKRPITTLMIQRFAEALNLGPAEQSNFIESIVTKKSTRDYQQITLDSYAVISDWYHYAILELTKTTNFVPNVTWVSKALGISKTEANIAVERLERMGLLEIRKGQWRDTSDEGNATNISGDLTSSASRKLQKQVLEMSLKALEEESIEVRNHTSMTMAIDPADLPLAKEKIKNFRRELTKLLEKTKQPKEVYHLNISLYPVSKTQGEDQ